ncbi:diguanylate cyclase/phosphodiesterase (GGDEF & EAL domains) with PAS/PAC sensor [Chitinispirillum alkaliphilum]|nr:diguanylate cyclase/phosphodiesterase (GGDEF & EAL domains) with PAS/PAC sensor [Chitinispirillum alkaliphilum]
MIEKIPEFARLLDFFGFKADTRIYLKQSVFLIAALFFLPNAVFLFISANDPNPTLITISLLVILMWNLILSVSIWKQLKLDKQVALKAQKLITRSQRTAKYFESILQDSTDIIFSIDTDGFIMKFNKGAQKHLGYTQEEIVGKPLDLLFSNISFNQSLIDTILKECKVINEELTMKAKSGKTITVDISMSEMKNDSNETIGIVATAKDITEKKKLQSELMSKNQLLNKLAITDNLTALYNSRHFHTQIRRELSRIRRNPGRKLSLMMIDVDFFKELNDSEGHQMGDHVLRSLGKVIEYCIRKDVDSAYRYGGDEFVVILPDTDANQSRVVAERIQTQFGAFKFGKTSLSIGIGETYPGDTEEMLIKRADEAMYASKTAGKDRISLAQDSTQTSAPLYP